MYLIKGGTIRREQKIFARSWVTLEELNTQLQEEADQYKLVIDSVVGGEKTIWDCPLQRGRNDTTRCNHDHDQGVRCEGGTKT